MLAAPAACHHADRILAFGTLALDQDLRRRARQCVDQCVEQCVDQCVAFRSWALTGNELHGLAFGVKSTQQNSRFKSSQRCLFTL